ncbi:MAG: hypothetical protein HYV27_09390 [Candidatus Hydrogenedentes bacterium]|nr:hypothetical protein [Candidatus Hydrogenedentota bacterium]
MRPVLGQKQTLILVAVLFSVPIVSLTIWSSGGGQADVSAAPPGEGVAAPVDPQQQALLDSLAQAQTAGARLTKEEMVENTMAEHRKAIEDAPDAPETAARWSALGNLYMQKHQDFQEAAQCFETLLLKFPAWEGNASVYPLLASCYEQLGDTANEQIVYKQMVEKLPPESKEYEYAQFKLGAR